MLPLVDTIYVQGLALCLGLFLLLRFAFATIDYLRQKSLQQKSLIDKINNLLPQTQCGQCGYQGCRPYARAISQGSAINQCPPGGERTIQQLSLLLNTPVTRLNPAHGSHAPRLLAFIREAECIGCTKCIQACPVDAILGATKLMHTVIEAECTGCDLCVEPCPVDCIDLIEAPQAEIVAWTLPTQINGQIKGQIKTVTKSQGLLSQ